MNIFHLFIYLDNSTDSDFNDISGINNSKLNFIVFCGNQIIIFVAEFLDLWNKKVL